MVAVVNVFVVDADYADDVCGVVFDVVVGGCDVVFVLWWLL